MNAADYRAMLKRRIDSELDARIEDWFPGLPRVHAESLRAIMADGKRLRGCLACLVAKALGGRIERALPAALAIELVQAASLVHDDFVDGDAQRRGRAAAWTWLTPRRAVLAADIMFATALERMARLGAAECGTLAHAIATMARGAFDEVLDEQSAYARMIRCKTGSLFAAAARLGALAAAAAPSQLDAASDFGMCLGEAYQVADDRADVVELRDKPGLQEAMRHAIALHIERAQAALERFPDNECTRMLRDMPAEFVSSMAPA